MGPATAPGSSCTAALPWLAPERNVRETAEVKSFRPLLLAAACLVAFACSAEAKPGWLTDFKQAQEQAKKDKKLLLLDFTGSDWCGWCIKLEREVFRSRSSRNTLRKISCSSSWIFRADGHCLMGSGCKINSSRSNTRSRVFRPLSFWIRMEKRSACSVTQRADRLLSLNNSSGCGRADAPASVRFIAEL